MTAIRLANVTKEFPMETRRTRPLYRELLRIAGRGSGGAARKAVDAVTCEIPEGSFVGLVGRNGAGKSTLLRVLCGILRPTVGTVTINGRVACLFGPKAGVVPSLSVIDNIFLNASMIGLGLRETRESVDDVLGFAELEEHRFSRLEHLSFGNTQRLFFGVMLCAMRLRTADIFLFDEWLAGVDAEFREKAETELRAAAAGLTVMVASHDTRRLRRMCDRVLYLDHGKMAAFGPTAEVLPIYHNPGPDDE